jgi:tyrosine-protein kinase Etk/Wzc
MKNLNADHLYKESGEKNQTQYFKKIWKTYSFHWPLFLISILLCLAAAFFYIQNVTPDYLIQAKISLKDSKKEPTDTKAALEQLDILQTPKIIESEVAIIKSRPLMRRVVNELDLWINYQIPTNYSYKDLYVESPVRFKLLKQAKELDKTQWDITIKSPKYFVLKLKDDRSVVLPFNKPLVSNMGRWQLNITKEINNYIGKDVRIKVENPEFTVTQYQKDLNVILDRTAPIVDLQINDKVPKRGSQVLGHLINAYKFNNIEYKNQETERTLKFIDDRLASLTQELTGAEKNVENYKSSIGLTDISSQSQFYLDNIQSNDVKLNEVNVQLNVINEIEAFVNSPSHSTTPATIGIADPGLVNLVEQLTKLELHKTRLLATTPEENPMFAPIDDQITSTKEAIKSKVSSIKASLLTTRKQLASYSSNFESSIKHIPGQERQYVSYKRQQGIKENLYVYLLQKREEIALSYASTLTDARTVEDAYYDKPEKTVKFPIAIALIVGLIIPAGFIAFRKSFRNRILTKAEIELGTSAPIICEIAHSKKQGAIVVLNHDFYAIGEQLRLLRTNLLQVNNNVGKGKVTLFTSSKAGEGKSFVASNIGASLAASGKKTILLELDLRRPQIGKILNLDRSKPGLSDFLNGDISIDKVIQPSGIHPDLFVMGSGTILQNPSELLEGTKMELLINKLRFEYDNILIDSPPMRLVTDAMILAPLCDVTLFIVRHNHTLKSELEYIEEVYQSNKLKNMHIVFNAVHMDERFGYSMDWGYYSDESKQSMGKSVFSNFAARF